jgi:TonB-linked SusC/RagA family outer membrane protein
LKQILLIILNFISMKNWQKFLALSAIFIFTCTFVFAQVQIRGKVSDVEGNPLPSVVVEVDGTSIKAITDVNGLFSIQAQAGQKLVTRFIGMTNQSVEIKNSSDFITIVLQDDNIELEDVVVVGYGTQKKQSVVGAIGTVKVDDIKTQGNVSNMTDALTGLIPGVSVLSISGMPGGDLNSGTKIYSPAEILIRGKTTWNNSSPLILVDGVERQMNDIDISEVESISVLKDASATAVFGVKGGNGVILITTKRGREGKTRFTTEAEMSLETPSKIIESARTFDGVIARNNALERTRRFNNGLWSELYAADKEIEYYRNGQYPYAYPNNDWHDIMLKDFTQSYRVNTTASGGTKKVRYFTSATFNHVGDLFNTSDVGQGYVPSYSYDRLNIRTNFDLDITASTTLKANFSGMHGVQSAPSNNSLEGAFTSMVSLAGETPVLIYEDGMYGAEDGRFHSPNPFYDLNMKGKRTYPRTILNMDYSLTQKLDFITQGLSFSGKTAFDNTFRNGGKSVNDVGLTTKTISKDFYLNGGYYDYSTKTYMLDGSPANMDDWTSYVEPSAGREGFGWVKTPNTYDGEVVTLGSAERGLYYELQLQYNRSFNEHSVTAMGMFSRNQVEVGSNWPRKREDWVGRITYDYDQRYLFETNGAYNGSEKFGPDYRFDFFPSVAFGWVMSNEKFFKDRINWVDNLKMRYSYGLVGNDNLNTGSTWPYLTIWDTYNFGSEAATYYGYPSPYREYIRYNEGIPGNPNLRWETAAKQNLGFEFAAFNYKLGLTVDIFNERRKDMLLGAADRRNTVPPIFGKPAPPANIGEAKSHGAELELTYRNSVKKGLNYWLSANWTVAKSEVVFKESTDLTLPHQRPEGKALDQTYSGISTGFINSWDDLYSVTGGPDDAANGFLLPGDMIMLDFNADGKYNSTDDNVPYGFPTYPQNNYGMAFGADYKGFDLTVRFVGAYNTTRKIVTTKFYYDNVYAPTFILGSTWSPEYENVNPTYPALALDAKTYNPIGHFDQFDGSFIRLQSMQLGYSLPKRWTEPLRINNFKVYVNGRNLLLWTKMPNDGVGIDDPGKNYPTKKQINFGLNVQF